MSTSPVDDRLLQAKVQNQTGNVPTADIEEEDDEGVPERTPEFELSRQLDETMRAVYKHLHDAFKDQTYKGQTLKFGRAYTAITQFHTDHSDELTQLQTASIACTRDQVAKYQVDLQDKGTALGASIDMLEASFARMNAWRPEDDPLKTMTLAQYVDKDERESHAAFVAQGRPTTPPPKQKVTYPSPPRIGSGMQIDVKELIRDIETYGRSNGGFLGKGLWFAINNNVLDRMGKRHPGGPLVVCKSEGQWKDLLSTLDRMDLKCEKRRLPGEQAYVTELTDVRHDGKMLTVQYWLIECDEKKHEDVRHSDPRANLLAETLSGKKFDGPALVQVWAQIAQIDAMTSIEESTRKQDGEPHEEHDAPHRPTSPDPRHSPEPHGRRAGRDAVRGSGDLFGNVESEDDDTNGNVKWSDTIPMPGGVSTLRHEATNLVKRAKAVAELGDHKTAYELAAQAHALRQKADDVETNASSASNASPVGEEDTVYKPAVDYVYPSGEVRVIEAGYYTESEHLARSMEEQSLWAAVMEATEAGVASAHVAPKQMTKYEAPLVRSESAADAITNAETLAPSIAHKAERARGVMAASREGSKRSSPVESPKMSAGAGPSSLPPDAISFKLPTDILTAVMATPSADHPPTLV